MKERPILFSGPMVNAILDGRKTMTRRVIKPQPCIDEHGHFCWNGWNFGKDFSGPHIQPIASPIPSSKTKRVLCPYGKPGERLWVRETWVWNPELDHPDDFKSPEHCFYRADGEMCEQLEDPEGFEGWKPSAYMPRWASRITLEITGVRVERLQEISEADADKEGFNEDFPHKVFPEYFNQDMGDYSIPECFGMLWDSINGKKHPWESNPFVWVIEFRKVKP